MRFIAAASSIFLLFLGALPSRAQSPARMSDPVFGIGYDPLKVHFEVAPARISSLCSEAKAKKYWLYAHWQDGPTEYFVISNQESSVSGVGVIIAGGKCAEGLPEWVLTGDPQYAPTEFRDGRLQRRTFEELIKFTPAVLRGLATDLLQRYTAAFGSKRNFLDAVRRDGLPPDDKTPVLKKEFESFSKSLM
jgi:hypothetical protein